MSILVKYVAVTAIVAAMSVVLSCSGSATRDKRSDKHTEALRKLNDSMSVNSPHVADMLKKGLDTSKDSLDYYDFYLYKLRNSVMRGEFDTAWADVTDYLDLQEGTPRTNGMKALLMNIKGGYYVRLHREPHLAVNCFKEAYELLRVSDKQHKLPDVCANLGDAYVAANDIPHAAYWYRRALFLSDSLNLPSEDNASLYMGLGRIYLNVGDYDAAFSCYETASANYDELPVTMKFYLLTNYCNYYYYTGDYEAAKNVLLKTKALLETHGMADGYDMYMCKLNMADVYLNLEDSPNAARLLDDVYHYFEKIGDETALYYCRTVGIGLALRSDSMSAVKHILNLEKADGPVDFKLVNIRQRYLRDYYVRTGDYKNAYAVLQENERVNDSLKLNIANVRASEIMLRYSQDTMQLHHQIAIQKMDADVNKARHWLGVGALLIVVLVMIIHHLYTYSRKRRLKLKMQLMQLRLLNIRSRLSPHFIFNVLNNRVAKSDSGESDDLMELVKLVRANLNISGKGAVSLKEELEFVKYYVEIERAVLDGELDFAVEAPDDNELESILVPSMLIQILVENSIKHGLKRRKGEKQLRVTVDKGEDECYVTVRDNGAGFDIRHNDPLSTKTGMTVIRKTINIINHDNKRKIRFWVKNVMADDGTVNGCEASLVIPYDIKIVC